MPVLFKKILVLTTAVILFASCGGNRSYQSVSVISGKWLKIKKEFNSPSTGIEKQIDDFCITLDKFFSSPIGSLYQIRRPEITQSFTAVKSAASRLKTAILTNDYPTINLTAVEIDESIDQLQRIDNSISNASQRDYFLLFFFFSLLVITIILVIIVQYSRIEKAETNERQSLVFSRETIIAQERERSRIARELHDTVAQDILHLSLQTEIMNKEADIAKRNRLCAEVVGGQREILKRIRNICENLIPSDFQRHSLEDALRTLCYNFRQRTNIECQLKIQKDLQLDSLNSDIRLQCFRIVQECLTNIEKHSGALEASVLVYKKSEGEFIISVSDDGKGFPQTNNDSIQNMKEQGHFGLWGMYERAAAMNGTLTVESEPGDGATVTLRITREAAL